MNPFANRFTPSRQNSDFALARNFFVTDYGAMFDGSTNDAPAINQCISDAIAYGGGRVIFPSGVALVNSPINVSGIGIDLQGQGQWNTVIQPGPLFVGTAVFFISQSNGFGMRDIGIIGASQTYSSNPACDGIWIDSSYVVKLQRIYVAFMNGWGLEFSTTASITAFAPVVDSVFSTRCKGGIHVFGVAPNQSIGIDMMNCAGDQAQVNEAILIDSVVDAQIVNCGGYSIGNATPSVHIKGGGFITLAGGDYGATNPSVGACLLIEAGANGSPQHLYIVGNVIEKGSEGITITAGSAISIVSNAIYFNQTNGIHVTGGDAVTIADNIFDGNGQASGTGHYDFFQNTGSGNRYMLEGNVFRTPGGSGVGQVQFATRNNGSATSLANNVFLGATAYDPNHPAFAMRGNWGLNPVGFLASQPAVPATTVALANPSGLDCVVYVTGGTVSVIAVAGTATGLTSGPIFVGAGQTITLTYTVAPTWTWFGG